MSHSTATSNTVNIVDDHHCHLSRPASSYTCPRTAPCITYRYVTGQFVPATCPTACGHGESELRRTVQCVSSLGHVVHDDKCIAAGFHIRPVVTQQCPATTACGNN